MSQNKSFAFCSYFCWFVCHQFSRSGSFVIATENELRKLPKSTLHIVSPNSNPRPYRGLWYDFTCSAPWIEQNSEMYWGISHCSLAYNSTGFCFIRTQFCLFWYFIFCLALPLTLGLPLNPCFFERYATYWQPSSFFSLSSVKRELESQRPLHIWYCFFKSTFT